MDDLRTKHRQLKENLVVTGILFAMWVIGEAGGLINIIANFGA